MGSAVIPAGRASRMAVGNGSPALWGDIRLSGGVRSSACVAG
jgi:hypothetical protein